LALSRIPQVSSAFEQITQFEQSADEERQNRIASLVASGDASLRSGRPEQAVAAYRAALRNSADASVLPERMADSLMSAGYAIKRSADVALLQQANGEIAAIGLQYELAQAELQTLQSNYDSAQAELQTVRARAEELEADLAARTDRVSALEAQLDSATGVASGANVEIERLKAREAELVADHEAELAAMRDREAELEAENSEAIARIDTLTSQLATTERELAGATEDARETRALLSDTSERLQARIGELETQVPALEDELTAAHATQSRQEQEIERLSAYEAEARQREELGAYLEVLRHQLDARTASEAPGPETESADPIEVLETKLIITKVLSSDAVQARYPDIVDRMNAYLVALMSEAQESAKVETLSDINEFLETVIGSGTSRAGGAVADVASAFAPVSEDAGNETYRSQFAELIESLERLLD
jgi:predicted  nucleic acid-binding Zn-ribbon protein